MSTDDASTLLAPGAELERLADGSVWSEGPLWLPGIRRVRWSDIPNDRIREWDAATGEVTTFRQPAEYTNGRTVDREGRVIQCSHGRRAIEREGADGPEIVVDRWSGGRFNSPNDLAVASDGAIWFTDPPYGIQPSGREGHPGTSEYDACFVFRWDPLTGEAVPVVTDMVHPNGIGFSPDGSRVYVSDTGPHSGGADPQQIRVFDVDGATIVGDGRTFARPPVGASDGFAIDREGRVWTSAGDGIYVYASDGALLAHVPVPETVSNCTFGGDDGQDLYLTATTSLYRIRTSTTSA